MLQNLPYFMYKKTHVVILFFISCKWVMNALGNECPGLCPHRSGHSSGKNIKLHDMKNEKNYVGFLITKIWQILKRFSRALSWAQTSYFWRVCCTMGLCTLTTPSKIKIANPNILLWFWMKSLADFSLFRNKRFALNLML